MRFFVFILVAWSVMFLMHLFVYIPIKRVFEISFPYQYLVLGALSALYFVASISARKFQGIISDAFYFLASTWLGIVFLLFSVIVPYEIFRILIGSDSVVALKILIFIGILLSCFALWNGRHLTTREYSIKVKKLKKTLKIVHLTDIHVGTVHQIKFLERVVNKTNQLKPDLVLITGDLFDGSVAIEEEMLKPLNKLNAISFFSNGNHEEYEGLEHVRTTLTLLKVELLENKLTIYDGVQIIGVNDRQSLPKNVTLDSILTSLHINKDLPAILMYHTPVEWEAARNHDIGLMLSGHTHNGQIYPFTLLVRLFFKYVNGLYKKEDKYLHVSPGTGTWGPPMRLGSKNQITVLNLHPIS